MRAALSVGHDVRQGVAWCARWVTLWIAVAATAASAQATPRVRLDRVAASARAVDPLDGDARALVLRDQGCGPMGMWPCDGVCQN